MSSESSSNGDSVTIHILRNKDGSLHITGNITIFAGFQQEIEWISPKSIHRGMSFSGSGLPYHNAEQAYENTKNTGIINSPDGSFVINMPCLPSAYYTSLGSTYVPPVLLLETIKNDTKNTPNPEKFRTHVFLTSEGVPYRWIAGSPPGQRVAPTEEQIGRAIFYNGREELGLFQNQEMLCRSKGYPSNETAFSLLENVDVNPWKSTPSPA
jgi:hypothetical protein